MTLQKFISRPEEAFWREAFLARLRVSDIKTAAREADEALGVWSARVEEKMKAIAEHQNSGH